MLRVFGELRGLGDRFVDAADHIEGRFGQMVIFAIDHRLERTADVHMVTVPGTEGDFSVLEGHAPFMATLRNGPLTIYATAGAAPEVIEVEGGFAEVNEAGLTVLAEHIAG